MSMMELFKKSVAFSLGAAAFSAEKLKQFTDDMVARGEMSSDDAKKFVDDMTKRADEEKKTIQGWVNEQVSRILQQAGAVEATRVDQLELRIAALERRVAELATEEESLTGSKGGFASQPDEFAKCEGLEDLPDPEGCD